mgnify:CR=1 FL=1
MGLVRCDTCGGEYKALDLGQDQAMHCSATIFVHKGKKRLLGHYGSTLFDGSIYNVMTEDLKYGIVCDACIEKHLNTNRLELVSDHNYFGISE